MDHVGHEKFKGGGGSGGGGSGDGGGGGSGGGKSGGKSGDGGGDGVSLKLATITSTVYPTKMTVATFMIRNLASVGLDVDSDLPMVMSTALLTTRNTAIAERPPFNVLSELELLVSTRIE